MDYKTKLYAFLIFISAFILYSNTLNHDYALDDLAVLKDNKFVQKGIKGIPDIVNNIYWRGYTDSNTGIYRPLSLVFFAIEYEISPNNPSFYHLMNIIYYSILCSLIFIFLSKYFLNKYTDLLFYSLLIFTLHPIHSEVVANIKSRDEILALLFMFLTFYLLFVKNRSKFNLFFVVLFFLLALLSKESSLMFLPVFLILDYTQNKNIFNLLKKYFPLIVVSLFWFLWRNYIINFETKPLPYTLSDNSILETADFITQKATGFKIYFRYILKLIYPYEMSFDYSFNQIKLSDFSNLESLFGFIFFLILFILMFFRKKIHPLVFFSILIIFFPLLLISNTFILIGTTMADRLIFTSSLGSCVLVVYLLFTILKDYDLLKYLTIFVYLLLFSFMTYSRNKVWENNFTLFTNDVNIVKNSARVHCYCAEEFLKKSKEFEDKYSLLAEREFIKCYKIYPYYFEALLKLGNYNFERNSLMEAKKLYLIADSLNPNHPVLNGNIGVLYSKLNNNDSAKYFLHKAIELDNEIIDVYSTLGSIYFNEKKFKKALSYFKSGLKIEQNNLNLLFNAANSMGALKKYKESNEFLFKAISINPKEINYYKFVALNYKNLNMLDSCNFYLNLVKN